MRPLVIHQPALRAAQRELEQARDDLAAAVATVQHPADGFPRRDLLVEGVKVLLDDAIALARRCEGLADALHDSLVDFDDLDHFVAQEAAVFQVGPR